MRKQRIIGIYQLLAVFLAAVLMAGTATPAFALETERDESAKRPIMVSLGDSYSSGEGVEPFYGAGRTDKFEQPDFLAHRSKLSWPGKLKLTDSAGKRLIMSQHKAFYSSETKSYDSYSKNNWYFVASSGAVTGSLNGTQNKSFDNDPNKESSLEHTTYTLDNQLKVFQSIEPGATDYVTMTMGGNDAHFADVFIYAAFNCSFINVNGMDDYLDRIWDEFYNGYNSIQNRLRRAYTDIHRAAGNQADIIIAGYPKILPEKGFLLFSAEESKSIDTAITKLNQEMEAIVQSLQSEEFKIHFVSVEEAFEGHEIYTGVFKEYINGIKLVRADDLSHEQVISSYSLHPNQKGVKAYANCVQKCIDQIEEQKAQNNVAVNAQSIIDVPDAGEETEPAAPTSEPAAENPDESTVPATEPAEADDESVPTEETVTLPTEDDEICLLTADLSELGELEGAQVTVEEPCLCSIDRSEPLIAQSDLCIPVVAAEAQVRLCFFKPGHTKLHLVIDSICAGQTLELTDALKQAAAQCRLMNIGDVDCDGCVGETDVSQLVSSAHFGAAAEAQGASDLNEDGIISLEDIAIILLGENYGASDYTFTYTSA